MMASTVLKGVPKIIMVTQGDAYGFFVSLRRVCTHEKEPVRIHYNMVNKRHGKFEKVRNFGTVKTDSDVARLYSESQHRLNTNGGQQSINFENPMEREIEVT